MDDPLVLIVGGGMLQVPMIEQALALGLRVAVTDQNHLCPARYLVSQFWPISTMDVEGHRQLGKTLKGETQWGTLCGVVTAGADCAPAVAAAAEGGGVRGIPLEVAKRTHSKLVVRELLEEHALDVYSPRWCYLDIDDSYEEMLRYVHETVQMPCIVKPVRERASRGVSIAKDEVSLLAAIEKVWHFGTDCLVEQQLQGTEHSVELIRGEAGEVLWYNIVDRYFDYTSGIPIERGHVNPTRLNEKAQQAILLMTLAAAHALGATWGPLKIDCMMTTEGQKILECTARLSGGYDCQWSSPVTDRHPMKLLLQLACGLPIDEQAQMAGADGYGAVAAVIPKRYGTVRHIPLPEWTQEGIPMGERCMDRGVLMTVKPGDRVAPLEHNGQRAGYVMAHGVNYQDTWEMAQGIAQEIAEGMEYG